MSIPAGATPRPWLITKVAGVYGSVVSRDPEALRRDIELRGEDHVRAYGGVVVGESIQEADRELIVRAVNEYEALLAVAVAASDAIAQNAHMNPGFVQICLNRLNGELLKLDAVRSSR